jgi:hypothetical protein
MEDEANFNNPKLPNFNLEWQAPEYENRDKHPDWYWHMGAIAVLAILLCLLVKNFLFAIIILIASFTITIYARRTPAIINLALTNEGVRAGQSFYPYKYIKSFWVERERENPRLIIETDRFYLPHILLPLGDKTPEEINNPPRSPLRRFYLRSNLRLLRLLKNKKCANIGLLAVAPVV